MSNFECEICNAKQTRSCIYNKKALHIIYLIINLFSLFIKTYLCVIKILYHYKVILC